MGMLKEIIEASEESKIQLPFTKKQTQILIQGLSKNRFIQSNIIMNY